MSFYDFKFLGKRPSDFGELLHVKERDIGFPSKNKITKSVANSNLTFDFSAVYGSQTYGEREVKYVINVMDGKDYDPVTMHGLKTELINWILGANQKQELYDDSIPEYHFLAEAQSNNSIEDGFRKGDLTITFTCYPFMIRNKAEGDDDWDSFDFDEDIAQDVDFDVDGTKTVYLINDSISESYPSVKADAAMTVMVGNAKYDIAAGNNDGVALPVGDNEITITGKGHITFVWHKEVI